jgi:hypothetical protein
MRLADSLVQTTIFNCSRYESQRKVECLETDELCLPLVQNTEMSQSELLGVECIKLLEETVLEFDSSLRLFIAVPNSVIVSHVSIRPVSMVRKFRNTYF